MLCYHNKQSHKSSSMNSFTYLLLLMLLFVWHANICFGLYDSNFAHKVAIHNGQHHGHNSTLSLNNVDLISALNYAEDAFERMKRLENSISQSRIKIRNQTVSFGQLLDNFPNDQSKEYDRIAQIVLKASSHIFELKCASLDKGTLRCGYAIAANSIPESTILKECRSYKHNHRGINTYRRLLPPHYSDGLYKIPHDHSPAPKNISETLYQLSRQDSLMDNVHSTSEGVLDDIRNIAVVQWAQFIEHDLVKTVVHTMSNNKPIECCEMDSSSPPPRYVHPACAPLKYENGSETICLNYVRSAIGLSSTCAFGPGEQLNQATNALDLSQLYGTSEHVTETLRSHYHGDLLTNERDHSHSTLPDSHDPHSYCMINSTDSICYRSGDTRVNLNPYVTTLYTIFLRSHNRLARLFHRTNRTLKDDKLFHLARRLNTHIYNKIVFEELAPIILGQELADRINAEPLLDVHRNGAVSNEFATVGIRFYYSMMPGDLLLKDKDDPDDIVTNTINRNRDEILRIKEEFYKPRNLSRNNELDRIVQAILNENAMALDTGYVGDVTRYMYQYNNPGHRDIGSDILALDINRGRDHGIAKYVKYLEVCTQRTVNSWEDLERYINDRELSRLKRVYGAINKIDLIIGALAERPIVDGVVGPTFACIIAEQLSNTRRTAPHFYTRESEQKYRAFVSEFTGAKLICQNTELTHVPRNIFKKASPSNPLIVCSDLRDMPHLAATS